MIGIRHQGAEARTSVASKVRVRSTLLVRIPLAKVPQLINQFDFSLRRGKGFFQRDPQKNDIRIAHINAVQFHGLFKIMGIGIAQTNGANLSFAFARDRTSIGSEYPFFSEGQ